MVSEPVMFDRGYLTLGKLRGIPIRIHWTMPVGALVFGGLRFAPAFWVGFLVLVLIHELGHAFYVKRYGHRVLSIEVTGFGGLCRWSGAATPYERAAIAWGGVVAQGLLLIVAHAVLLALGPPRALWSAELAHVFTVTNLWLIGLNLLPIPPLDGAEAWPLARHVFGRLRSGRRRPTPPAAGPPGPRAPDPELRRLAEKFRSIGDQAGRARRP
jgi:stage IV sporulation protein FB